MKKHSLLLLTALSLVASMVMAACAPAAAPAAAPEAAATEAVAEEANQAITSLIKELVAGAKPYRQPPMKMGNPTKESSDLDKMIFAKKKGHNEAIDQFEQNLLKALEEV